jgi:hypothetical protein
MRILLLSLLLFVPLVNAATETLNNVQIKNVVVGNSSAFKDGAWLVVQGLVGNEKCQYAPTNTTLFYTKNSSYLSTNKALSILMAAKIADKTIDIQYIIVQPESELYGYGISECEIVRMAL